MSRIKPYNVLTSIIVITLLVLSSYSVMASRIPESQEEIGTQFSERDIYPSSEDERNGDEGGNNGGDIPDPGVPPSGPSDPGDVTDKIGGFVGTTGAFVSFETTEDGISEHSLRLGEEETLNIFEEISVENYDIYQEEVIDHNYVLRGKAVEVRIYDTPSALLKLRVNSLESERKVSFRMGDIDITDSREGDIRMEFEDPRLENYFGGLMTVRDERGNILIPEIEDDFINYTIEDQTTIVFSKRGDDDFFNHVKDEISLGNLGAELRIEATEDIYNWKSISYRDVNLMGQIRDDDSLEIMASSESLGDRGTILFFDLSSEVLEISSPEEVKLYIDGELASIIDDYRDFNNRDDPSYWMNIGNENIYLLVNIPHFSTHSITIEYVEEISEEYFGSILYYLSTAVISVVLVTIGVLYRKHNKGDKSGKK